MRNFILLHWCSAQHGWGAAASIISMPTRNCFWLRVAQQPMGQVGPPLRAFSSLYIFGLLMLKSKGCLLRILGCGRWWHTEICCWRTQSCSVLNMLQDRGACSNVHGTRELHDKGEAMQLLRLADSWLRAITLHGVTYSWPKKVGRPAITAWASYSYLITPTSRSHRIYHCFMQSPRWFQAYLVTQSEAICPPSWWFRNSPWV